LDRWQARPRERQDRLNRFDYHDDQPANDKFHLYPKSIFVSQQCTGNATCRRKEMQVPPTRRSSILCRRFPAVLDPVRYERRTQDRQSRRQADHAPQRVNHLGVLALNWNRSPEPRPPQRKSNLYQWPMTVPWSQPCQLQWQFPSYGCYQGHNRARRQGVPDGFAIRTRHCCPRHRDLREKRRQPILWPVTEPDKHILAQALEGAASRFGLQSKKVPSRQKANVPRSPGPKAPSGNKCVAGTPRLRRGRGRCLRRSDRLSPRVVSVRARGRIPQTSGPTGEALPDHP
jgi:hypothetical protein